jgi:hypothetical protein
MSRGTHAHRHEFSEFRLLDQIGCFSRDGTETRTSTLYAYPNCFAIFTL